MSTSKYKGCMSYEQTKKAWNRQRSGTPYATIAMELCVDVATLYRSYKHYGFDAPMRKAKDGQPIAPPIGRK